MTDVEDKSAEQEQRPDDGTTAEMKLIHVMCGYFLDNDDARMALQKWMCARSNCTGDCDESMNDKAYIILLANIQSGIGTLVQVVSRIGGI